MTEPLRMSFELACSPRHAFSVWTEHFGSWWPRGHTVSASPATEVVLQARAGGRIYERSPEGRVHEWGEVTVWEPPGRLVYRWYIGREPEHATEVEIRFLAQGEDATRVEVEHRGWDRLGSEAETWRDRNRNGWQGLMPHFLAAAGGQSL